MESTNLLKSWFRFLSSAHQLNTYFLSMKMFIWVFILKVLFCTNNFILSLNTFLFWNKIKWLKSNKKKTINVPMGIQEEIVKWVVAERSCPENNQLLLCGGVAASHITPCLICQCTYLFWRNYHARTHTHTYVKNAICRFQIKSVKVLSLYS